MEHESRHAVVIGAGIGGLLAARVLLDHVERVTVVDRDRFPERPDHRGGVPQSQHVHGLLPRGARVVFELFPGLEDELEADGALASTSARQAKIITPAGLLPLGDDALGADALGVNRSFLYFSRFFLEWHLRRRLDADGRVRFSPATEVVGLRTSGDAVTGVSVRSRDDASTADLAADLVVDASGRSSRAPEWLAELGLGTVGEETLHSQLSYASRFYARPEGFPDEFSLVLMNGRPPEIPRAGLVQDIENGVWHVTLGGIAGTVVPTDEEGFLEYAAGLPDPTIHEAIRVARPLTPIRGWRTATNRLRHFDRLPRWPSGLVVTGDAVCALNPIYGQGMTVSAMDAEVLRDCLVDHDSGRRAGFEREFQRRLARTVATPWLMASSEDLRWPGITIDGARPRGVGVAHRYLDAVLRAAVIDPVVARRYFQVIGFLVPLGTLFTPPTLGRVIAAAGRRVITERVRRRRVPQPLALSPEGLARARAMPAHRSEPAPVTVDVG